MTDGTNTQDVRARLVGVEAPTRDDHAATKKYVDDHGGGGSVDVTDGDTTVTAVTELDFTSGATVTDAGGGVAQVAVTGGGSQPAGVVTIRKFAFTEQAGTHTYTATFAIPAGGALFGVELYVFADWNTDPLGGEMQWDITDSDGTILSAQQQFANDSAKAYYNRVTAPSWSQNFLSRGKYYAAGDTITVVTASLGGTGIAEVSLYYMTEPTTSAPVVT